MRRARAARGTGRARAALRLAGLLLGGVWGLGCAMAPTPHPAARAEAAHARGGPSASGATRRAASARRVGLVLHVEPLEAAVFVNGEPLGLAKELRARGGFVPLARGVHRLRLEAPGYATWRAEVAVGARPERLTVALTPLP